MTRAAETLRPGTGQWATFLLAGEMFGLAVEDVQEVLMDQPLTPVPHAPAQMVGMLNLRGTIMPAVDLRRRLGFAARAPGASVHQLVLKTPEGPISVLVDEIGDVLALPASAWRTPPETLGAAHLGFVFGVCPIPGHVLLGLRVAKLGFDDEDEPEAGPGARQDV